MKKVLIILFGLLALASCNKDNEAMDPSPYPMPVGGETLLMATPGFSGHPEMIYSIFGDTIYQCEDTESSIQSLAADGADWYAVILRGDGAYNVVKNGQSICLTGEKIWCFAVEDGMVYTVQENKQSHTVWVCKNFQRVHEVVGDVLYNTFSVDSGNVVMAVYGNEPCYWCNGEFIPIEGIDGGFSWVYGIDKKGDDMLITYEDIDTRKCMYWWNGVNHDNWTDFTPSTSYIVANGHFFILGKKYRSQGVGGNSHGLPMVITDGYEEFLSTSTIDFAAVQLAYHRGTAYVLVKSVRGVTSYVFAGFYLLDLPDITIPDDLRQYYHYNTDGKMNLTELGITAIAVIPNQEG